MVAERHMPVLESYIIYDSCSEHWRTLHTESLLVARHLPEPVQPALNVAMADEGYSSTAWESTDNSEFNTSQTPHFGLFQPNSPSLTIHESATAPALSSLPVKPSSPPPRSSSDSLGRTSSSRWRDSVPVTIERKDTLSMIPSDAVSLVETSFDENVLRVLCELDVSTSNFVISAAFIDMSRHPPSAVYLYCWIGLNKVWSRVA